MPSPDSMDHPDGLPRGRVRRPLVLSRSIWSPQAWSRLTLVALALIVVHWGADRLLIEGPPPGVDVAVLDAIRDWRTTAAIDASRALTFLGDLWVLVPIWAVLVTLARRQSGRWDLAWLVSLVIGGALAITGVIKEITDRARPDDALVDALSHAFPSGHAARVAVVWGLVGWLALRWARSAWLRWTAWVVSAAMVLGTGMSRLVLGIHWPSDVLFGWVLGAIWLTACILIVQPRHGTPLAQTVVEEIAERLHPHDSDDDAGDSAAGQRDAGTVDRREAR